MTDKKQIAHLPKTLYELIETKKESNYFNIENLRKFLFRYGAYPDNYR